jgi:FSR family fosmidomycin resistance protein-like MFS transporter
METETGSTQASAALPRTENKTIFAILVAASLSHLLNDTIQSLIPAIYPVLKDTFDLNFAQIGLITLTFQITASMLQPVVGLYTDHRPQPFSLAIGMGFSLIGLIWLSAASSYWMILGAAALVGLGSSVFHPEASRLARMASGGRYGFAQSLFQVGGNTGSSLGPLLAAVVVGTRGQGKIAWFSVLALLGIFILFNAGRWYQSNLLRLKSVSRRPADGVHLSRLTILSSLAILVALIFSKFFYLASITSYYTFYLIDRFHLTIQQAQLMLFLFTFSVAAGTIVGGPVGDRIGRKWVIWVSILGVAPFTLLLPHANLPMTAVLSVIIGFILSSAFSAILVYAQELMPGKVGLVSGLFFGFAFGMGGIGSAVLGQLIDLTNIRFVFQLCAFLPLLGLLTVFLPNIERKRPA